MKKIFIDVKERRCLKMYKFIEGKIKGGRFMPDEDIGMMESEKALLILDIKEPKEEVAYSKNLQKEIQKQCIKHWKETFPELEITEEDKKWFELIGSSAEYSNTSWEDDKKIVMEYLWEKYGI
jgi:hypothetical protein